MPPVPEKSSYPDGSKYPEFDRKELRPQGPVNTVPNPKKPQPQLTEGEP
jgi:hypothetical protein